MTMDDRTTYERFRRQLSLKGFGREAQERLQRARVLVIGAGGLGCPVLQYLAAAGIGHLGVMDPDRVGLSNLHRQVLYTEADLGRYKVEVLRERLPAMNPYLSLETWASACDAALALEAFPKHDIVIDTSDNFPTRYLVNDGCVLTGRPLVHAAVSEYEGQVAVFNLTGPDGTPGLHYRHLFPSAPPPGEVRDCAEAGVLGVLPGIIGAMQALEAIKVLTGIGETLRSRLLTYDTLRHRQLVVDIPAGAVSEWEMPADADAYLRFDYGTFCGLGARSDAEVDITSYHPGMRIIDVREPGEMPAIGLPHERMPLTQLEERLRLYAGEEALFVCATGRRSLQAAMICRQRHPEARAYSLKGGLNALTTQNPPH
jgi:molybdopterin/thiamine biosynthesis adenylyltransferase/rhodanese-related sulfurtransferase